MNLHKLSSNEGLNYKWKHNRVRTCAKCVSLIAFENISQTCFCNRAAAAAAVKVSYFSISAEFLKANLIVQYLIAVSLRISIHLISAS